jgi:RNA polymerase sigma-70 factor, ECF subfamily
MICDGGHAMDHAEMGRGEALSPEQFEEFYAATMRALRSYICRITSNETVADDILQESYARLLNAPPMRDAQRRGYLYRVATNLIMDYGRLQSRQRRWWQQFGGRQESTETKLDLVSDIRQLFGKISVQDRALLWLAYVEGAEHREIADILRLREKSVRVLLHRARRRMEAILQRHGYEVGHD